MSHKTVLIDDFDGSDADRTISYAFDGNAYEIDLNKKHAKEFAKTIQPYIDKSRTKPKSRSAARRRPATTRAGRRRNTEENNAIRVWAADHGHDVSPHGRIPETVVAAYRNDQG